MERTAAPPPQLDLTDPGGMPPMDVIKCQCKQSCPMSEPCELEATDDDLLCVPCRRAKKRIEDYKAGLFSATTMSGWAGIQRSLIHCHNCDPEFKSKENQDANRD